MRIALIGLVSATFGLVASPVAAAAPTFTKDVAPILYAKCVECHRPSSVAPMSSG